MSSGMTLQALTSFQLLRDCKVGRHLFWARGHACPGQELHYKYFIDRHIYLQIWYKIPYIQEHVIECIYVSKGVRHSKWTCYLLTGR